MQFSSGVSVPWRAMIACDNVGLRHLTTAAHVSIHARDEIARIEATGDPSSQTEGHIGLDFLILYGMGKSAGHLALLWQLPRRSPSCIRAGRAQPRDFGCVILVRSKNSAEGRTMKWRISSNGVLSSCPKPHKSVETGEHGFPVWTELDASKDGLLRYNRRDGYDTLLQSGTTTKRKSMWLAGRSASTCRNGWAHVSPMGSTTAV